MDSSFERRIHFEISEIDLFLDTHSALLKKAEDKKESGTELLALEAFFHTFYLSIENLLEYIIKTIDRKSIPGKRRHKHLLDEASAPDSGRPHILSETTRNALVPFLGFYEFFRHSPVTDFDRKKLARLADDIFLTWEYVKADFIAFANRIGDVPAPAKE